MNMSRRPFLVAVCSSVLAAGAAGFSGQGAAPLAALVLPSGFKAEVFAENVGNARSMALGPQGTVFVGSQDLGKAHAVVDWNGDHKADQVLAIARVSSSPMASRCGTAPSMSRPRAGSSGSTTSRSISTRRRRRSPSTTTSRTRSQATPGSSSRLDRTTCCTCRLATCNVCLSPPMTAAIVRMKPDGSGMEAFAEGVRNSVGFDWHPVTREFWFTDNGRDDRRRRAERRAQRRPEGRPALWLPLLP